MTGGTSSPDFPTTPGAFDTTGGTDAFVAKLNPAGSTLAYSTFLGGSDGDGGSDLAIDGSGNVYVTGVTGSADFPVTPGAFDTRLSAGGGGDPFVVKLNAAGSALVYSTFLGGADGPFHIEASSGIAVDADGSAYVTGDTNAFDFPTTPGAFDTTLSDYPGLAASDVYVTKLNQAGSALVYSTFLGEIGTDQGWDIQVDRNGSAFVFGNTDSHFPTTPGAIDTIANHNDVFVTKLNPAGSGLVYSTLLGERGDEQAGDLAIDAGGSVYVTGNTDSPDFPTTPRAFDRKWGHPVDAFVAKLNPTGSALVYSTFLGANRANPESTFGGHDSGFGLAVNGQGNAYVTGLTDSERFPTTPGAFDVTENDSPRTAFSDAFLVKLNVAGSALAYSTLLGERGDDAGLSVAVDSEGRAYVTGSTRANPLFPTTRGAFDRTFGGEYEGFVAKIDPIPSPCVVPKLVGSTLAEARRRVRRANCTLGAVRYVNSRRARGRVVAQRPRPGAKLRPRGRVKVGVSKGPAARNR